MTDWQEVELDSVATYGKDKMDAKFLDSSNYISTDNMLPNIEGICNSNYVPVSGKVAAYEAENILVSNIRPYFKKIWFARNGGGCSNDVIIFKANQKVIDPKFLYYQLCRNDFFDFMMSGASGVKMPRGNRKSIPKYKFLLPPIESQNKIAKVLSSYDGLIEKNTKQIKLLEELATTIYEEWFIRMRFPNYENVKISKQTNLPEGWRKLKNHEICDFQNGYAYYTKGYSSSGYVVIDLGNIGMNSDLLITGKEKFIDAELYSITSKFHLRENDIVIAMTDVTSELGILAKTAIIDEDNKYVLNQRVGCLRPKEDFIDYSFLYALLNDRRFISKMKSVSKGAVQFYFNTKDIVSYEHVIPDNKTLQCFQERYKPLLQLRKTLKVQNKLLKEARNVLLPRLMSGVIDIENLQSSNKLDIAI